MSLGSNFDAGIGIAPVNLATGANTGARQFMGNLSSITVLFIGAAGAAAEPPVLTLKGHTAVTAGTTANLAVVDTWYTKSEATLDNDEAWTANTQAAAATVTGTAQVQQMIAFTVRPEQLAAGQKYISVDIASVGVGAQVGTLVYIAEGVSPHGVPTGMPVGLR